MSFCEPCSALVAPSHIPSVSVTYLNGNKLKSRRKYQSIHLPTEGDIFTNKGANSYPNIVEMGVPPSYHQVASEQIPVTTQINSVAPVPERRDPENRIRAPVGVRAPTQAPMWSTPRPGTWPRWSGQTPNSQPHQRPWGMEPSMRSNQKAFISIRDKDFLRRYYEKIFQNLQQTNCRVLAKAYVKLVEPRKQVNFPYNGRKIVAGQTQQLDPDDTKPPWWPTGVSHREPDHLPKAGKELDPFLSLNILQLSLIPSSIHPEVIYCRSLLT